MAQSQWIILLGAAALAAIVLVRLFVVLGRRSGTEFPAVPPTGRAAQELSVNPLPSQAPQKLDAPGLFELQMADRSFDAAKFLEGARTAYGLIVTAFEKGDRDALKPLVSPDVLEGFSAAIATRGEGPGRFRFAAVKDAAIEHASMQNGLMEIIVRFEADFETVEGVGAPHPVTDHWSFSRAVGAADPNWTLVATAGEAA
ncbi:MAG: Tim44 domain-containing protein [Alphaproteobacteria bacterium]|nr:Tim44 domain-containing protein [Alphaproteobacteria bacterium]